MNRLTASQKSSRTRTMHCTRPPSHCRSAGEPAEELRLAGMLIEAAVGKVDWTAYPDQAAEELKGLIEAKCGEDRCGTARELRDGRIW